MTDMQKQLNEMYAELENIRKTRNRVTVYEFAKFAPLFKKDANLSMEQIHSLTEEYRERFDIFEDVVIVDAEGEEVLRLPRILLPLNSTSEKFNKVIDKVRGDLTSEIPKYASEAFGNVINVFLASQTLDKEAFRDKVMKAMEDFSTTVREFEEKMGQSKVSDESTQSLEEGSTDSLFEW